MAAQLGGTGGDSETGVAAGGDGTKAWKNAGEISVENEQDDRMCHNTNV